MFTKKSKLAPTMERKTSDNMNDSEQKSLVEKHRVSAIFNDQNQNIGSLNLDTE